MPTGGKGYSFMAWLRLEAVERAPHRAGRALFTLLARSGGAVRGVAAAIRGALRIYMLSVRTVQVCSAAAMAPCPACCRPSYYLTPLWLPLVFTDTPLAETEQLRSD